ncbi:MAG: ABC transporter ATP-binding protein [Candidatus Aminicenantes bacterium]|nr:ABC transporter ATP-binding protein [Candidatus Aminicenantes bacterium]
MVIETRRLTKSYQMGETIVHALRDVDFMVETEELIAVMGASGSGKSTLLNILGCLDKPSSGEYILEGKPVSELGKKEYAPFRNEKFGFVFQSFNLLPRTSALENVELPLVYDRAGRVGKPRRAAEEALRRVGLGDRMHHMPNQLSGGEQQRVAIARALVNNPAIILADEPTGNLDTSTSADVMTLFQELNRDGMTIIVVTHDPEIAECAKRIVLMRDGRIHGDNQVSA